VNNLLTPIVLSFAETTPNESTLSFAILPYTDCWFSSVEAYPSLIVMLVGVFPVK
jgi:hypothetical protein